MSDPIELHLSDLVLDAGTQGRASMNQSVVTHYAELDEEGEELDPIDVVIALEGPVPWDGFHRIEARRTNGRDTIKAKATHGTIEDAQFLALSANKRHGLMRTKEDCRAIVERALVHPRLANADNEVIAGLIGISLRSLQRHKKALGLTREYTKHEHEDPEVEAAIKAISKQFPDEAEAIRKGDLAKSKDQLVKFANLDAHHREALAPLFLSKNLSIESAKDATNLRPVSETIPIGQYLRYAQEHPDDACWLFANAKCRVDILWLEEIS